MTSSSPTPILPANPASIARAADLIRAGGLVAFPTETVYGLGADATDSEAVARIFTAKARPLTDPVIVHLAHPDAIADVGRDLPPITAKLAARFMPGPLTLIVPRGPHIPAIVSAGRETVAVRVPSHPVARALITAAATPIAAPSANRFSRPSATSAAHVLHDLDGRIDLILDGGPAAIGVESTILDLTTTPPTVRRPGGVPIEALRDLIPDVGTTAHYLDTTVSAPAPGQSVKHYSPRIPVLLYTAGPGTSINALSDRLHADLMAEARPAAALVTEFPISAPGVQGVELGANPEQVGAGLFDALRRIEQTDAAVLYIAWTRRDGLGAAVWDRLLRAAEGRVIVV